MKRFYFIAVFVFMSINCLGQDHLTFKGISINGSLASFTKALTTKGFTVSPKQDPKAPFIKFFNGKFMDKTSKVWVLHENGSVWKVMVLQEYFSWSAISSAYNDAVKLYTNKYGEPKDNFKMFLSPYYEGDGFELQAVRNDKCIYSSYWFLDSGTINVKIGSFGGDYFLIFQYEDKINADKKEEQSNARAMNDI